MELVSLLERTAVLGGKSDLDKTTTLFELNNALDVTHREDNKAFGQIVLDHQSAMESILAHGGSSGNSLEVVTYALWVLVPLAWDEANGARLFQDYPDVMQVLVGTLEPRVDASTEQAQIRALDVLENFAFHGKVTRELFATYVATLVPLLLSKIECHSDHHHHHKQVQLGALYTLQNLASHPENKRELVANYSDMLPLLLDKIESGLETVQVEALKVLRNLAGSVENAQEMMASHSDVLLPLLVKRMSGETLLQATTVVYGLSCCAANQSQLRLDRDLIEALTKGRENKNEAIDLVSLLTLVNLFGAEEDSAVLQTDGEMLESIVNLLGRAMSVDGGLAMNNSLLALRYLCVVESNRQQLWGKYGSEFLTTLLDVLWRAIGDGNAKVAENAMATLAQFSNDADALEWMRANKPQLDKVFAELGPFTEALKTVQLLLLTVAPPKVVPLAGAKSTIMISYNRKYQPQARLIHHILEANGFTVWRDEQDMKTDIVDSMAKAVSSSHVVLVLVSRSYRESSNCQMECKFAHNNNRKLIPVLMEDGYDFKADGWLGLLLGSKLFYDASKCGSNRTQLEAVMRTLLAREVEDHAAAAAARARAKTNGDDGDEAPAQSKPQAPQNEEEIREWLSKYKHGDEVADKLAKEGLVEAGDLEFLSHKNSTELKSFLELNGKQVMVLETALGELF